MCVTEKCVSVPSANTFRYMYLWSTFPLSNTHKILAVKWNREHSISFSSSDEHNNNNNNNIHQWYQQTITALYSEICKTIIMKTRLYVMRNMRAPFFSSLISNSHSETKCFVYCLLIFHFGFFPFFHWIRANTKKKGIETKKRNTQN